MLFTSDLDRTLIFSNRMMGKYPVDGEVTAIEYKADRAIGFMSQCTLELLQQFHENNLFVPVTTRAVYQYERLTVFQKWIKPQYAITSNGGTLLVNGQPDAQWSRLIREKLSLTSSPKEDLLQAFEEIRNEEWVVKERLLDGLFYMFHVKQACIPYQELSAFEDKIAQLGWRLFLHSRKLYILPAQLNKAFAVAHLQNYVDYDMHVAAGDSLMDYDMLIQADIGYSPTHGELFDKRGDDSKVKWLQGTGTASAEELLRNLLST